MIEVPREVHVERLVGKRARDPSGKVVGRLEEMRVEIIDGEPVITEFHFGPAAMLERIGGFFLQLPFFSLLPFSRRMYCARWQDVDLADARHPRVNVPKSELKRVAR